ncbi:hypothetical protein M1105_04890 [Limibaculum sp. FT325]|uniref:hypothetical protein n=1 Tax=Thermohalobaculum sediminis TaxID=2939436 RepID=UPI0020BFF098|nr:hypothetical protein [Limibaculum sediminis]MCL5776327.1 hypothetical protein [Limibaculum sediminis]
MIEFKKAPITEEPGPATALAGLPDWPDYLPAQQDMLVYWLTAMVAVAIVFTALRAIRALGRERDEAGEERGDAMPQAAPAARLRTVGGGASGRAA